MSTKIELRWVVMGLIVFGISVTQTRGDDSLQLISDATPNVETVVASFGDIDDDFHGECSNFACTCKSGLLGGLIKPTSSCFSSFISPMTNPVFFEDPRIQTEAKVLFIQNRIPLTAGGNSAQLYAVQVQAALSDRLSIVADKDGYVVSQNPLVQDGWADVAVGLKYLVLADYKAQRLLSIGASYELPVGSTRSLQGNGDGEFHLYASAGAQIGCNWHWISGSGFRLPADTAAESQVWYWSNHLDRQINDYLYFLTEVNWYHWMQSGKGGVPGVEGLDLFNLGSTGVAGNDIVTGAIGIKARPRGDNSMEVGVAWEAPLTQRRDIIDNRLTVDCILRY